MYEFVLFRTVALFAACVTSPGLRTSPAWSPATAHSICAHEVRKAFRSVIERIWRSNYAHAQRLYELKAEGVALRAAPASRVWLSIRS